MHPYGKTSPHLSNARAPRRSSFPSKALPQCFWTAAASCDQIPLGRLPAGPFGMPIARMPRVWAALSNARVSAPPCFHACRFRSLRKRYRHVVIVLETHMLELSSDVNHCMRAFHRLYVSLRDIQYGMHGLTGLLARTRCSILCAGC